MADITNVIDHGAMMHRSSQSLCQYYTEHNNSDALCVPVCNRSWHRSSSLQRDSLSQYYTKHNHSDILCLSYNRSWRASFFITAARSLSQYYQARTTKTRKSQHTTSSTTMPGHICTNIMSSMHTHQTPHTSDRNTTARKHTPHTRRQASTKTAPKHTFQAPKKTPRDASSTKKCRNKPQIWHG